MAMGMVMTMVMAIMALPIATATITTVIDILLGINNLAVTGMIIVMDQVTIPVIGDETTGQGGRGQPESH
jgi:hypothetical protein